MRKTLFIAILLMLVCASLGVSQARQKDPAEKTARMKTATEQRPISEMKTSSGQITKVDVNAKTLTLREGGNSTLFVWDEKTKITELCHLVKPSALVLGARATVHYTLKQGKKRAQWVEIYLPGQWAKEN